MSQYTDYATPHGQDDAPTDPAPTADDIRPGMHADSTQVREIPITQLKRNPYQPRNNTYYETLDELTESVRQYGILQPILVRQMGPEQYEVIAGERRVSAANRAGLTTVPALIKEMDDQQQAEVALIENLQREDLSPVETALAFRTLMNDFHLSQQDIARKVGKSKSAISHLLRLLELSDTILDSLNRDEIQEAHALILLQLEDNALREDIFQQVLTEKLSVKQTRQRVRAALGEAGNLETPAETGQREPRRTELTQMTEAAIAARLRDKFARRVEVQCPYGKGGQVAMSFHDREDMIALVDTLLNAPG